MSSITTIEQVFVSMFGRPGDAGGVKFWAGILDQASSDLPAIANAFASTVEFQAAVAGKSNPEIIQVLYKNMFGHAADAAALISWATQLGQGVSLGNVVINIASAAQGADLIALQAKTTAATAFTGALVTPEQIAAYANPQALEHSIDYLDYVHDAATLAIATRPYALNQAISSILLGNEWEVPEIIEQQVQDLYVAYFSRPADPAGLAFWSSMLDGNSENPQLASMAASFGISAEYRATYAQTSAPAKIAAIYEHLFSRPAEIAGLDYWSQLLETGLLSLDKIVATIAASARFSDKTVFEHKTEVAIAVTRAIDTPAEQTAYQGKLANERVTAYLAEVKDNASYELAIMPVNIDALIASFSGNSGPLPPAAAPAEIILVGTAMAQPDYLLL